MPSIADWRSATAADQLMRLDQEQFAIEFLRRNPAYREDYRNTQRRISEKSLSHDTAMADLARRWGLSFPTCPRLTRMGIARTLATGTFACRCHSHRRS